MSLVFANNAASTLAVTATLSDTVLTVATGQGVRFPNPGVGDSFIITVQSGLLFEIMECTARTGDNLTVIRAREGTAAQTWTLGSTVTMRVTAGTMAALEQRARALASFAPINGPISLSADPAGPTEAVRESYLAAREADIRADLGADILSRGRLVGEIIEFPGPRLPSRYLWCAGQAVSRATYSELFDALTDVLTVTTVAGSPNVTITAGSSAVLDAGTPVSLNGVIPNGATVVNIAGPTLTLSANASSSLSGQQLRICPHGVGNNTTTFNVPDRRGLVPLGRDNVGGLGATNRVTVAGSGVNGFRLGVVGGSQGLQSHAHGVNDPTHNHPINDPGHAHPAGSLYLQPHNGVNNDANFLAGSSGSFTAANSGPGFTGIGILGAATGISIQSTGAGGTQNIQPSAVTQFAIFTNVP